MTSCPPGSGLTTPEPRGSGLSQVELGHNKRTKLDSAQAAEQQLDKKKPKTAGIPKLQI